MRRTPLNITIVSVGVSLFLACTPSKTDLLFEDLPIHKIDTAVAVEYDPPPWTEINIDSMNMVESMAYADSSNFIGKPIYPCARCFLRPEAANSLAIANSLANELGLRMVLFDCYRPLKYQKVMFDLVQNPRYVAEPKKGGSMHNKGLAVDLSLADLKGNLLEFGSDFDEFSERSHHDHNKLDSVAKSNRALLKRIMIEAGFEPYANEWWHYSYKKVDYELDDFVWDCDN